MTKTTFHDEMYDMYAVDFIQSLFRPKVELFDMDLLPKIKESHIDDIFESIQDSKVASRKFYDPLGDAEKSIT